MGQKSLKFLNRVGYNMYWNSIWEDNNNYSNTFIKFFFIDLFLNHIFKNNFFKTNNIINNKKKFYKYNSFNFFQHIVYFNKPLNFFNSFNFFQSKVWVLSYQNWLVIHVYIYITKSFKLKHFKKKKLKNLFYDKYLINYNFL